MAAKILVVDDKVNVQNLLTEVLTCKGFEVKCASNGRHAILALSSFSADLILLDIMMPQMDGYEFIGKLRITSNCPVIMITAKQSEQDIVKGFELGADDYICKPFRMSELLVRIQAVLKRTSRYFTTDPIHRVANLSLNSVTHEVRVGDTLLELTLVETRLLSMLVHSAEHTVKKQEICRQLIELGYTGSENTLKIHIRNLRSKLDPLLQGAVEIESVFGVGYRLRVLPQ